MRVVVQRVKAASVEIDGKEISAIKCGLLLFFAVHQDDVPETISLCADKILQLRIFSDENDKMNRSILDIQGEVLVVSQFTLYADTSKGRRPSFFTAAAPEKAKSFYETFINKLSASHLKVASGEFGANMQVQLINDGPVTIILEFIPNMTPNLEFGLRQSPGI